MKISSAIVLFISSVGCATAAEVIVPMNTVNAEGVVKSIGNVTITESPYGLVFSPSLEGLGAGTHGFHVHENPSCDPKEKEGKAVAALAAGGHYDPKTTKHHGAPWGHGHLGDVPALVVGQDGKANYAVLAPRLKLDDIKSRALMIHEGGDNYSDEPTPLGGGGPRIACGVIKG
ncbi:superoxide dismutase [Cu-Zn] SodC [Methylobacter sp.]|uniref:superoxide dismutase [Cu-Zn] SodC n=1 Tax=Methylobacter sp. TaxID=2051955 RepID=UPI002FDCF04B